MAIDPSQIKQKAQRKYKQFLQASIEKKTFFPLELPIGKIPQDYIKLRDELKELLDNSKAKIGYGYSVELTTKNTRKYGAQSLPTRISIDSEADYLKLLNKKSEFNKFQNNIQLILDSVPQLEQWLLKHPQKVIEYANEWEDLLKVCRYFMANYNPNLYLRELPIAVHTKFIEENQKIITSLLEAVLPPEAIQIVDNQRHTFEQKFFLRYEEVSVRMRILDERVKKQYHFPVFELTTSLSEFKQLNLSNDCFITENKMNFLTLPNLKNSFAIWGEGYRTLMLKSVDWLASCKIFYWGDIDADGFKILSQFRKYFPQTVSVMMDEETFKTFEKFAVEDNGSQPENLPNLTKEEHLLYSLVSSYGKRLEQEHISQNFAIRYLRKINN